MLYVIVDSDYMGNVTLIKAEDEDEIKLHGDLKESQRIVFRISNLKLKQLCISSFMKLHN